MQARLNLRSSQLPPLQIDGIFGVKTLARVREFQRDSGLKVDGIAGPQTLDALASAPPQPDVTEFRNNCSTHEPGIERQAGIIAMLFQQQSRAPVAQRAFGIAAARSSLAGFSIPTRSAVTAPSLPPMPSFRKLTPAQEADAVGVYGTSLDFSTIFISNQVGLGGRPFTAAVAMPGVTGFVQVMNMGTFAPTKDDLIHELAHVWQSQHSSDPTQFMKNSVASQAAAVAANAVAAALDRTVTRHPDFKKGHFPSSAYAFERGKPFKDYAAEQIANQVEKNVTAIVAHVAGVGRGAVDPDNRTSLSSARIDDRRAPRIEI